MDAIREAHNPGYIPPAPLNFGPDSAVSRFARSMIIDSDKGRDGVGYDIETLRAATPEERTGIEALLLRHGIQDWRDIEAYAALGTTRTIDKLIEAARRPDPLSQIRIAQYAPDLIPAADYSRSLVRAIRTAAPYEGLTEVLLAIENFHPPEVIDALFEEAAHADGGTAMSIAALLLFLHGKAESAFDWNQRPFLLRFSTNNREERTAAIRELCDRIGRPHLDPHSD